MTVLQDVNSLLVFLYINSAVPKFSNQLLTHRFKRMSYFLAEEPETETKNNGFDKSDERETTENMTSNEDDFKSYSTSSTTDSKGNR